MKKNNWISFLLIVCCLGVLVGQNQGTLAGGGNLLTGTAGSGAAQDQVQGLSAQVRLELTQDLRIGLVGEGPVENIDIAMVWQDLGQGFDSLPEAQQQRRQGRLPNICGPSQQNPQRQKGHCQRQQPGQMERRRAGIRHRGTFFRTYLQYYPKRAECQACLYFPARMWYNHRKAVHGGKIDETLPIWRGLLS